MAIHHRLQARARLPLLLYQLAKTGQDKFAVLFNLFVGERVKRIEEYSSGSFVGLGGFGKCGLKFCLGHLKKNCEVVYLQSGPHRRTAQECSVHAACWAHYLESVFIWSEGRGSRLG